MDHNDIRHSLSEYLDGSISDDQKAEIEAHLKTCTECSKALEDLRKTIEQLKAIEQVEPPAWMTQKIMANVREEAAKKKGLFEKVFYPLTVKLPLQAVAMVFLAVTAFYIYQETHPTAKYAEAPAPSTQEFAAKKEDRQKAQSGMSDQDSSLSRAKQVPQTPSYKSLDMKAQNETPSTPSARNELPASAPAAKLAPEKKEMMMERRASAPQAFDSADSSQQSAGARLNEKTESKQKRVSASRTADKLNREDILVIFKQLVALENDLLSAISTGIGKSGKSYIELRRETERYSEEVYNPALESVKNLVCQNEDDKLLTEFIGVLIATSGSADEYPSTVLGDIYLCRPKMLISIYEKLEKQQQNTIYENLRFGFANSTYKREKQISNYNSLKKQLELLSPKKN